VAQVERHGPPPATFSRPAAVVSRAQPGARATQALPGRGPGRPAISRAAPIAPAARIIQQGQGRPPTTQFAQKPAGIARLGGWSRPARGPARDQAAQQWRQGHQGWDQSAPWRRDRNWWRGNDAFSLYVGVRSGFFFIPEIGYVSAPRQYRGHHWQAGQYLPNWFWRYRVSDYWNYGLPEPPDGCFWVWVNNDMALIDTGDGFILDIVHNAW
jgi:Ni/Co efflux regulator RcnB